MSKVGLLIHCFGTKATKKLEVHYSSGESFDPRLQTTKRKTKNIFGDVYDLDIRKLQSGQSPMCRLGILENINALLSVPLVTIRQILLLKPKVVE